MATYYPKADYVWNNWGGWHTSTSTTTTASWNISTQDHVWYRWTDAMTTIGTAATTAAVALNTWQDTVWTTWQTMPHTPAYTRPVETAEERQARLDREQVAREAQNRRWLAEQERAAGARERAKELLEMILTPEEKLMRDNTGKLQVRGSEGNLYEINVKYDGVHGNITRVDEHGCVLGRLCVAPQMYDEEVRLALPLEDGFVGQLLGLKFNEADFVAKANWSGRRACQRPDVPVLRAA